MLKKIGSIGLAVASVSLLGMSSARAQDENPCGNDMDNPCGEKSAEASEHGDGEPAEDSGGHHGLSLGKGKLLFSGDINVNLSSDEVGNPIGLTPDITYGVSDQLDVGLYHSSTGISGFWVETRGGICLIGDSCTNNVYNGPIALLASFSLVKGKLSATGGGGAMASGLSGNTKLYALKAGAKIHYALDAKMGITAEPAVFVAANERSAVSRDTVVLPLAFTYALDAKLTAGAQTGVVANLDNIGDTYHIPLNVGARYQVDNKLAVGGAFGFINLAGKGGETKERALSIFAHYAL